MQFWWPCPLVNMGPGLKIQPKAWLRFAMMTRFSLIKESNASEGFCLWLFGKNRGWVKMKGGKSAVKNNIADFCGLKYRFLKKKNQ